MLLKNIYIYKYIYKYIFNIQCAHATVMAYESAQQDNPDMLQVWRFTGQTKVAVKCDSEADM